MDFDYYLFKGKTGFDEKKYEKRMVEKIKERSEKYDTLLLEIGGKFFEDKHAARVLPGFQLNTKVKLIKQLKNVSAIIVMNTQYFKKRKKSSVSHLCYEDYSMQLLQKIKKVGIRIEGIVLTFWKGKEWEVEIKKRLEEDYKVGVLPYIPGYPRNFARIFSEKGFGMLTLSPERKTTIVIAATPTSGKMATALAIMYNQNKKGKAVGFTKLETFPVWNLPINNEINLAYEAATADIGDYLVIDPFFKKRYGKTAVNYNRDVESFPILKKIMEKIGITPYPSPTEMVINEIKSAITSMWICRKAARLEILRRYFSYKKEKKRIKELWKKAGIKLEESRAIYLSLITGKPVVERKSETIVIEKAEEVKKWIELPGDFVHAPKAKEEDVLEWERRGGIVSTGKI